MRGEAWRRFMISRAGRVSADECPCNGCKTRDQGCHGKCADYAMWRSLASAESTVTDGIMRADKDVKGFLFGRNQEKNVMYKLRKRT